MHHARAGHIASILTNGKVLVTGGWESATDPPLNDAELYDPSTGLWTMTGNIKYKRAGHTASVLTNGKVLVTGGGTDDRNSQYD